jgi:hypothetical protein
MFFAALLYRSMGTDKAQEMLNLHEMNNTSNSSIEGRKSLLMHRQMDWSNNYYGLQIGAKFDYIKPRVRSCGRYISCTDDQDFENAVELYARSWVSGSRQSPPGGCVRTGNGEGMSYRNDKWCGNP